MQVKIKKLSEHAVIPTYAKHGDAGLDLTAISFTVGDCYTQYNTGLAIEIPEGFAGLIFPRSGISNKANSLANSVGLIDSGYRGEIVCRFKIQMDLINAVDTEAEQQNLLYQVGDKIAQLVILPIPVVELILAEELSETQRGNTGFGSSGK